MQKLFGEIIKMEREGNEKTQEEVAEKLHVSKQYVSAVERGEKNITASEFENFLVASGSSLEKFVMKYLKLEIVNTN